jgi:hypothetical protein
MRKSNGNREEMLVKTRAKTKKVRKKMDKTKKKVMMKKMTKRFTSATNEYSCLGPNWLQ